MSGQQGQNKRTQKSGGNENYSTSREGTSFNGEGKKRNTTGSRGSQVPAPGFLNQTNFSTSSGQEILFEPEWLSPKKGEDKKTVAPMIRFSRQDIVDAWKPSDLDHLLTQEELAINYPFYSRESLPPVYQLPPERQEEVKMNKRSYNTRNPLQAGAMRGRGGGRGGQGRGRPNNEERPFNPTNRERYNSNPSERPNREFSTPPASSPGFQQNRRRPDSWREPPGELDRGNQITSKSMMWIYEDPSGNTQGPFSDNEMHQWFSVGYFSSSLMVKRVNQKEFVPLGTLIGKDGGSPFLSNPSQPIDRQEKKQRDLSGSWRSKSMSEETAIPSSSKDQDEEKDEDILNEKFGLSRSDASKPINPSKINAPPSTGRPFSILGDRLEYSGEDEEEGYAPVNLLPQDHNLDNLPWNPESSLTPMWENSHRETGPSEKFFPNNQQVSSVPYQPESSIPLVSPPSSILFSGPQMGFVGQQSTHDPYIQPNLSPLDYSSLQNQNLPLGPFNQPQIPMEPQPLKRKEGVFVLDESTGNFVPVHAEPGSSQFTSFPPQEHTPPSNYGWNVPNTQQQMNHPDLMLGYPYQNEPGMPNLMDLQYQYQLYQMQQMQQMQNYQNNPWGQPIDSQPFQQQFSPVTAPGHNNFAPSNQDPVVKEPHKQTFPEPLEFQQSSIPVSQHQPEPPTTSSSIPTTPSSSSKEPPKEPSSKTTKSGKGQKKATKGEKESQPSQPSSSQQQHSTSKGKEKSSDELTSKPSSEKSQEKPQEKNQTQPGKSSSKPQPGQLDKSQQETKQGEKDKSSASTLEAETNKSQEEKQSVKWKTTEAPKSSLSLREIQEQEMQERLTKQAQVPKPEPTTRPAPVQGWSKWNTTPDLPGKTTPSPLSLKEIQEQELKRKESKNPSQPPKEEKNNASWPGLLASKSSSDNSSGPGLTVWGTQTSSKPSPSPSSTPQQPAPSPSSKGQQQQGNPANKAPQTKKEGGNEPQQQGGKKSGNQQASSSSPSPSSSSSSPSPSSQQQQKTQSSQKQSQSQSQNQNQSQNSSSGKQEKAPQLIPAEPKKKKKSQKVDPSVLGFQTNRPNSEADD